MTNCSHQVKTRNNKNKLQTNTKHYTASKNIKTENIAGKVDEHNEPLDLRPSTTWDQTIDEISTVELIEVQIVNSTVPFMFISSFTPLLKVSPPPSLHPLSCLPSSYLSFPSLIISTDSSKTLASQASLYSERDGFGGKL